MPPLARVVLLTRSGCHLCDEAASVVATACAAADARWRSVDVDSDPDLRAAYTDHVPVVFVDGELHGYWFVSEEPLTQALESDARPVPEDWRPPLPAPMTPEGKP